MSAGSTRGMLQAAALLLAAKDGARGPRHRNAIAAATCPGDAYAMGALPALADALRAVEGR